MKSVTDRLVRIPALGRRLGVLLASLLAPALVGCVSSPPQTVELADVVMEEMALIEQAHRRLVRAYFSRLEAEVDRFVSTRWTPDFLDRSMQVDAVTRRLAELQPGVNLDEALLDSTLSSSGNFTPIELDIVAAAVDRSKFDHRVRFSDFMLEFSDSVMTEINLVRDMWQSKLRRSELDFMSALDDSYGALREGHLTIRSHLDSVANVTVAQDRLARRLGLLESRERTLESVATAGERLEGSVEGLNAVIDALDTDGGATGEARPLDADVLDNVLEELEADDAPAE